MGQRGPAAQLPAPALAFGYIEPPIQPWLWLKAKALLWPAIERGGNHAAQVEAELGAGRAQLWLGVEGDAPVIAAISRMDGDTFEIWLAAGPILSRGLRFLDRAIEAAKEDGATNGRIIGRKGWQRVLRTRGWRLDGEDLVKDFTQ